MNVKQEKHLLRERMKELRSELTIHEYREYSQNVMNNCMRLDEWQSAKTIHIYVSSKNNEVETLSFIYKMFDERKQIVVPKCDFKRHVIQNIRIESMNDLKPSRFGLMEPDYDPRKEVMPEDLDIVFAPLLAFDRTGGRLGFGGGYYDDLLRKCSHPVIGLGYAFQEIDAVPIEPSDEKLDIIVTEHEVIRVNHE